MFILLPRIYERNKHLLRKDLFLLHMSMLWSVFRIKLNIRICHQMLKMKLTDSQKQRIRIAIEQNRKTIEAYQKMLSRPI